MLAKIILSAILISSMATAALAEGLNGVYGGVKIFDSYQTQWGGGQLSGSAESNTFGAGLLVGFDFYQQSETPIRTELEYSVRTAFFGENEVSALGHNSEIEYNIHTVMASAYYDFYNESIVTPYVGGGIGMGFVNGHYQINSISRQIDNTVFAWQAGAGVGIALSDNVTADVGYRYLNLGEVTTEFHGDDMNMDVSAHEFSIGLRFGF